MQSSWKNNVGEIFERTLKTKNNNKSNKKKAKTQNKNTKKKKNHQKTTLSHLKGFTKIKMQKIQEQKKFQLRLCVRQGIQPMMRTQDGTQRQEDKQAVPGSSI